MNSTPNGERLHIALFGRCNSGKSSLMNAICGQEISIVSDLKGTTTDPVSKAIELSSLGPVLLIDTPGLDDESKLGNQRLEKTTQILKQTDLAVLVFSENQSDFSLEEQFISLLKEKNTPFVVICNKHDYSSLSSAKPPYLCDLCINAKSGDNVEKLTSTFLSKLPSQADNKPLVRDLLVPGDRVILVVPIDESAPKGRLILPQQQVIRDILESGAIATICRDCELADTLSQFTHKPKLIITDSQVFESVAQIVPKDIPLTSFSILFSRYKGNLKLQLEGIRAIPCLQDGDRILIAEGCTHHRQCEDIGTVKIPRWLEEFTGKKFMFDTCSGAHFPSDLSSYRLVIHCGGCTLNKKEMQVRLSQCKNEPVPIVNYGTLIAHLKGVLERSVELFS